MPLRNLLLKEAHERIEQLYPDTSQLEDPKQKDGVTFRLTKDDKECGGDGVPVSFVEYDVPGSRPIDVFNVLTDASKQPTWDDHCAKMDPIGDFQDVQAQGYAGEFVAPGTPVAGREGYEWMVVEANFTTEDFWVVFSTYENGDLKQKRPFDSGVVEMQNCLAGYHLTKTATGTHIVNTQQINSHSWPLSARYVANQGWTSSVDFAAALKKEGAAQQAKGWNNTQVVVPAWMLVDRPCGEINYDVQVRNTILNQAKTEMSLDESQRGTAKSISLASGASLKLWQSFANCGGSGVSPTSIPKWWAEFEVPNVDPAEVFNRLVNKEEEHSWHAGQGPVNITGFHGGARGIHEEFKAPKVMWHQFKTREMWEWQAAEHNSTDGSYLLALQSAGDPFSPSFGSSDVSAFQCLAAYKATPVTRGGSTGTLLQFSSHLNPNIGLLSKLRLLWQKAGEQMVKEFADSILAAIGTGSAAPLDGGSLSLLAPPPEGRNDSLSIDEVVALDPKNDSSLVFRRGFSQLDLPKQIDVSATDLTSNAESVYKLYQRLQNNATEEEKGPFQGGAATTALTLQRQGESLAAIQIRTMEVVAKIDCEGDPDWDHNHPAGGLPFGLIIGIAVAVTVVLLACISWCCCRFCRGRLREKRSRRAAQDLLNHVDQNRLVTTEDAAGTSLRRTEDRR